MKSARVTGIGTAIVIFSALAYQTEARAQAVKPSQCTQIVAEAIPATGGAWGSTAFSATKVEDLRFTVLFPLSLKGDHIFELKVYTPKGGLYEVLTVPVSTSPVLSGPNASREVPGYPRPLPVQKLETVTSKAVSYLGGSASLLVGGTQIMQSSLYGRWRVEPYLDGDSKPCGPSFFFALKP